MENKQLTDDLQFMRSVIEKTHRQIDPGIPIIITWGLICLVGYPTMQWLIAQQKFDWINPLWFSLYAIGFPLSFFFCYRLNKKQLTKGQISHVTKQVGQVWGILVVNGIVLGTFGLGRGRLFNDIGFMWAWIYCIAVSMMGIVYSKEWLYAGIGLFIGILLALLLRSYSYIILGLAVGGACIVPSIIALRRLRRLEKEDGQQPS
jgi:hypothetical protein